MKPQENTSCPVSLKLHFTVRRAGNGSETVQGLLSQQVRLSSGRTSTASHNVILQNLWYYHMLTEPCPRASAAVKRDPQQPHIAALAARQGRCGAASLRSNNGQPSNSQANGHARLLNKEATLLNGTNGNPTVSPPRALGLRHVAQARLPHHSLCCQMPERTCFVHKICVGPLSHPTSALQPYPPVAGLLKRHCLPRDCLYSVLASSKGSPIHAQELR